MTNKILFLLFIPMNLCLFSQEDDFKISDYDISINYSGGEELGITAKLSIETLNPVREIKLLTDPQIQTQSVTLQNAESNTDLQYKVNNDSLLIVLPTIYEKSKSFVINYTYKINIDTLKRSIFAPYPWYPFLYDCLSKFKLKIHSANDLMFYAQGELTNKVNDGKSSDYVYEMKNEIPRVTLIIAPSDSLVPYKVKQSNVEFNYYLMPRDTSISSKFISESISAFNYYSNLIGPYRYTNLTFIEIPDYMAVNSQPSFVIMGSMFVEWYIKNLYDFIPHEVAHQWFGSGMIGKHGDNNKWVTFESSAEYLRLMYDENTYGADSMKKELAEMLSEYRTKYEGTEKDKPLIESGPARVTYLKGPYVLNLLRHKMGDKGWTSFLRNLYQNYRGKFLTYNNVVQFLASINKDYADFFLYWTTVKGI